MKLSDIMSGAGLAWYAEVAMILFLIAFAVIVVRIFRPGRKQDLERASRLPLEDERATQGPKEHQG